MCPAIKKRLPKLETNKNNRRLRFTVLMTGFAACYGGLVAFRRLQGEPDIASDMIKLIALIGLGTAVFAFIFWTLTSRGRESKIRGMAAGLLTAVFTVPLPQFAWIFKSDVAANQPDMGLFDILAHAFDNAARTFYYTFSLAEGLAVLLSVIVGFVIAKSARDTI